MKNLLIIILSILTLTSFSQMTINARHFATSPLIESGGSTNLLTGLVSLWELNESSAPIIDEQGVANAPADSIDGVTYQISCVTNLIYGIEMDGTDPFVRPNDEGNLGLDTISVSFWFRVAAASDYFLRYVGTDGWFFRTTSGGIMNFSMNISSTQSAVSNVDITDDIWHHCVGMYTGDSVLMYIDNVKQTTFALQTGEPDYSNYVFEWGTNAGTSDYDGELGQVAIYRRKLTEQDISDLWSDGDGRKKSDF